jgi:hypothetical protein
MIRVAFALLFGWAAMVIGEAQGPAEAAAQLAARISSQEPRRTTVSLELQDLTTTSPLDLASFRSALYEELGKSGLTVTATQPEVRLRITISESPRGLLLVAEMVAGENRSVVMLPWIAPPASDARPRLRVLHRPIFFQADPVLDLLLLDSELLVLSPAAVSSFGMTDGKWTLTGAVALSLARLPARDARGRIENAPGGFRVYLPGTTCSGTLQPALRLACAPGNERWPLNPRDGSVVGHWVTDRNVLESDGVPGPFYAGANGWFSTADHRIIDRAGNLLLVPEAWGSDFASVESSCRTNPMVLASGAGDNPNHDQVQAYEIASGRAMPASEPIPLAGPITALWPAETGGQATLVVRNSKTGNYEASRLGVACAE